MWCRTGISFISASTFEKSISERSVPLCFIARVLTCKSTLRRGLRLMPRIHLSCKCIPLVLPGHGPQCGLTGSMKEDKPGSVIRLAGSVPDSGDEASKRILGGGRINPNRSLDTPSPFLIGKTRLSGRLPASVRILFLHKRAISPMSNDRFGIKRGLAGRGPQRNRRQ